MSKSDAPLDGAALKHAASKAAPVLERELLQVTSVVEACQALERAVAPLGYSSVDYGSGPVSRWPMHGNLDWKADVIYASYDWADVYFATHYQKHDRMLPHMLQQVGPWLYWDVWDTPADDPITRELERMTLERLASGISIPFHGPGLRFAAVNLGSQLSKQDLAARDVQTRPYVFLMASLTHARIQGIARGKALPIVALSPRETECLTWAARGKTAWETGVILAISESAVKKYLGSASAKLEARTGAHAIAIALSRGLISP